MTHLQHLCSVFGELATAVQQCCLPKISAPKSLWEDDVLINVVGGSDDNEPDFNSKTVCDGIDLEFDGCNELFITIQYRRFTYCSKGLDATEECDPLLSSLIHHCNPYACNPEYVVEEDQRREIIMNGSELEHHDGCLYRVVSVSSTHVSAKCSCYPQRNNAIRGKENKFDIQQAKVLIEDRLK